MKKIQKIIIPVGLIILSYLNIYFFNIRFSTADDYLLCNIISGALGTNYDFQLLYINNILGIILKILYNIIPFINIYTLYLITLLSLSFSQILNIILKEKKYSILPVVFVLYILTLYNITYTIIAYLTIAIGFLELIFKKDKKSYYAYFFIINGVLLRAQTFIPVFGALGMIVLYNCIKNKESKRIISFSILITIIFVLNLIGNVMYKSDEVLNEFKQWQDASIKIRDYKVIDYDKYELILKKEKWNENDLKLFYSWNFADKEKYTIQAMKNISNSISLKDRYNLNSLKIIKNYFKQFFTEKIDINNIYIIIFIVLFVISIVKAKNKKECLYVFFATIIFNFLLIVRQRNLYRVVYPQYLIASIYFIYLILTETNVLKNKVQTKNILVISIVVCTMFTATYLYKYQKQSNYYLNKSQENNYITEQLRSEKKVFIISSNVYNELTMFYKISNRKKIGEYNFLIKAGGGDCFSKRYYNFIQMYNLENSSNLYKNLKQDNVLYIGNVDDVLDRYLKENVDENWQLKKVKDINNIEIYKYIEETKNN